MLSRTADHLYWMSRYMERAEDLARLVDAHYRMSLLPHSDEVLAASLGATVRALHMEAALAERHASLEPRTVFEFVCFDRDYPGSIVSCLRLARENARAVRGTLTLDLWETLNATWLEARALSLRRPPADIGQFVEWVKERSHLQRGVMIGTMMRDEAFHFTRIGTFLERANATARLLTAHERDLAPEAEPHGARDPFEWSVMLRAFSAFEIYRRAYREAVTPLRVAQLLILRDDMPRSLLRCCKEVCQNLNAVSNQQSAETQRRAGAMHAELHFARMEDLATHGLPRFLEQFLEKLRDLGDRIATDFLIPPVEA